MSGNVWEWCWDKAGSYHVYRGGSWDFAACAVSYRGNNDPVYRDYNGRDNGHVDLGFRLIRNAN